MSHTDMTADQQVDALRAEGLEVDTQLSEDSCPPSLRNEQYSNDDFPTDYTRFTTLINTNLHRSGCLEPRGTACRTDPFHSVLWSE